MRGSAWLLLSSSLIAAAAPANAQDAPPPGSQTPPADAAAAISTDDASAATAPASAPADNGDTGNTGDIIVTATRRASPLSDVPIAISAVSGQSLAQTGAVDIRGVNQLSPSLFVSSSSSEAVGAVARIRGVGTVGDNPGLESSVGTFIDGVYRSRAGVALTELGSVDRVEVLRGPQGTLFGRNTSAGLINVITTAPSFTESGEAEFSLGNYDYRRAFLGLTGPINDKVAYRVDGVWMKRDGFLRESNDYAGATDRDFANRDRWLVRGQLLAKPTDDIRIRLIADYAKRNEDCCAATFLPARDVVRGADGSIGFAPSSTAALLRSLGGVINDDPFDRRVSVTPGRDFRSDVKDWGVSGELNWDLGGAQLTSITAYRGWNLKRGQDGDFENLDLVYRDAYRQTFRTFTQEVRLQGKALGDRLDWLVGGFFLNEKLRLTDNLRFGADYGRYQACRVAAGAVPASALSPATVGCIAPAARPAVAAQLGPFAPALLGSLDRLYGIANVGPTLDRYAQDARNWALFTHNVLDLTDSLSLTLGARYSHDRKSLDASIASDTQVCTTQRSVSTATVAQATAARNGGLISAAQFATIAGVANSIQSLACASNIPGGVDGQYRDRTRDGEWSGTAVLSWKPVEALLTYASYSRGYKAGGYNLDRAGLVQGAPSVAQLRFAPEKVDAFELGAKYKARGIRVSAAAFYQLFDQFQLNTFNGVAFLVENIGGCGSLAGGDGADSDLDGATGACTGKTKSGVVSKGIELEASLTPFRALALDAGFTLADTRFRDNLVGLDGRPLPSSLFVLPGSQLSNAPEYTLTGAVTWTPEIGARGLTGLVHVDARYQSKINTGSDLVPEKAQDGFATVNARLGITGADKLWSLEFWAQNLFDVDFRQVVSGAPLQGSGNLATVSAGGASPGTGLFILFPGEPRTFGVTARTVF